MLPSPPEQERQKSPREKSDTRQRGSLPPSAYTQRFTKQETDRPMKNQAQLFLVPNCLANLIPRFLPPHASTHLLLPQQPFRLDPSCCVLLDGRHEKNRKWAKGDPPPHPAPGRRKRAAWVSTCGMKLGVGDRKRCFRTLFSRKFGFFPFRLTFFYSTARFIFSCSKSKKWS